MSKDGRFPGSSFIQILISLARCGEIPGGILTRKSSNAIYNKYKKEYIYTDKNLYNKIKT